MSQTSAVSPNYTNTHLLATLCPYLPAGTQFISVTLPLTYSLLTHHTPTHPHQVRSQLVQLSLVHSVASVGQWIVPLQDARVKREPGGTLDQGDNGYVRRLYHIFAHVQDSCQWECIDLGSVVLEGTWAQLRWRVLGLSCAGGYLGSVALKKCFVRKLQHISVLRRNWFLIKNPSVWFIHFNCLFQFLFSF